MPSSTNPAHQATPSAIPSAVAARASSSVEQSQPLRAPALNKAGLPRLYDPGLATTQAYASSITLTDGPTGTLRYRGFPIEQLVAKASFDEVVVLLLEGTLPTATGLAHYRNTLAHHQFTTIPPCVLAVIKSFPRSAHPMPVLVAALAALTAAYPDLDPSVSGPNVYDSPANVQRSIDITLAIFPTLLATIHAHTTGKPLPTVRPRRGASYAERFLTLVRGSEPTPEDVALLDTLLSLHADHEQNCSTSAVRHISSSGASLFTSLSSGTVALSGHLHGGASEAVLHQLASIGSPAGIPGRLADVRAGRARLMGFGHRVYRAHDPRAILLRKHAVSLAARGAADDRLLAVAVELERAARADDYFVKRELFPNVDFYSGIVYRALGFGPQFFTPMFALGRIAGWVAHWKEFLTDADRRIARPRQHYCGPVGPLRVPSIEERDGKTTHTVSSTWLGRSKL